jgi:outer membrane protein TolC
MSLVLLLGSLFLLSTLPAATLTRSEAVALALQHNLEVKLARSQWDAARARALSAWSLPDPEIGAEFEQLSRPGDFGGFAERSIGVSQTIESPMKWWLNRRAVAQEAEGTRAAVFEWAKLDVSTRVVIAFDQVLLRKQVLRQEAANELLLQEFTHKARLRHDAGDVPELAVLRAEVEAGRATSRVEAAKQKLELAQSQMWTLLGAYSTADLQLEDAAPSDVQGDRQPNATLQQAQSRGLQNRSDLQGALRRIEEHRALRNAERAGLWPDITVGVARQTLREGGKNEGAWRVGLGLEVPIWGGFRKRGALAERKADLIGAQAEADRLRQQIMLEVQTAYVDLTTASRQLALFDERILQGAEQAQFAAARSYVEGKASYLEVLDSQRSLLHTRIEYANILFNYRKARAALERACGGGVER